MKFKVKIKFIELFGETDEEDDCDTLLGPYSPSIEMADEILQYSCKKVTVNWIVQFLMFQFNIGKIANKVLFKKVAKFLAGRILRMTQYPGEFTQNFPKRFSVKLSNNLLDGAFVQLFIEEYFEHHGTINSEKDIYKPRY